MFGLVRLVLRLRPLASATFLVWGLRIGACGLLALMTATRTDYTRVSHGAFKNPLTLKSRKFRPDREMTIEFLGRRDYGFNNSKVLQNEQSFWR